jgi:hypothetical protein
MLKIRILATFAILVCLAIGVDTFVNNGPRIAGATIAFIGSWLVLHLANRALSARQKDDPKS